VVSEFWFDFFSSKSTHKQIFFIDFLFFGLTLTKKSHRKFETTIAQQYSVFYKKTKLKWIIRFELKVEGGCVGTHLHKVLFF
jgi:hypothetical protein